MAADINARNRAASRNVRRAGLGQLSEWTQNQALMRNQRLKDEMIMPFMQQFLSAGYTEDMLSNLRKQLRNR
jgi:hypothetical protein